MTKTQNNIYSVLMSEVSKSQIQRSIVILFFVSVTLYNDLASIILINQIYYYVNQPIRLSSEGRSLGINNEARA